MSVVTSDPQRSVRSSEWSSASELLALPGWPCFPSPCSFRLPLDTSLLAGFQRGGCGALESSYTGELKCHGLKNILSWCDEYFTVGIFLVSVVSFLPTHRSTYSCWRLADGGDGTGVLAAQSLLCPKHGLRGKHRSDSLLMLMAKQPLLCQSCSCKCSLFNAAFNKLSVSVWNAYIDYCAP